ncbi:MAG: ABC transporter ATP-binding protein [Firmicutes bacterium]|nr:ABC transporter ATP-binding protein [Bacillota bacterium]MCL5038258.1 ABC transporter ATP-binding protein [Bacillota bacterium]
MLRLKGVDAYYGQLQILKGVDLEVRPGEIVTLLGANGAGKTTTLKTIVGLLHPRAGEIVFKDKVINRLAPDETVRLGLSLVPEGRQVFPALTVFENLMVGAFTQRNKAEIERSLAFVYELFPRLTERKNQLAGTLSGGEQQMLAIGRALMSDPEVFLLDEPSLGLSPLLVEKVFATIQAINRLDKTILLVEQNAYQALQIAHRGYVLETGRIVLSGSAASLLQNEHIKKAYLGQ